jgi:hypothetical protein
MGAFSNANEKEDVYELVEATRSIFENNKHNKNNLKNF